MTTAPTTPAADPVRLTVDYPEGPRDRLNVLLRVLLVIPILVVLVTLSGGFQSGDGVVTSEDRSAQDRDGWRTESRGTAGGLAGGIVALPTVLMLVFRRKYPRWWFDWNREFSRFGARVGAYLLLLRDEYPSTDEEQAVHLEIDYPDAARLNRWLPLVKWLLAVPHYIAIVLLGIGVALVTLVAWFVILFTGRYPRGLFDFVVGVLAWGNRVSGYAFLLVTDQYPPFSLE